MYCACDRQAGRSVCVSTQPDRPVLILTVCIEDNSHMMKMLLKMSAYAGVILLTFDKTLFHIVWRHARSRIDQVQHNENECNPLYDVCQFNPGHGTTILRKSFIDCQFTYYPCTLRPRPVAQLKARSQCGKYC